ncbi:class I SAM-dependent methyltransferase [Thermodesulfobacteriota bacterium]
MAHRVCPVWIGYLLASPIRRLFEKPEKILGPYVDNGMTVLDIGCAMGFFSLPMAELVGNGGRVVCVDLQERMLEGLKKRAAKAGLSGRIESHQCSEDGLGLEEWSGRFDFALMIAVMHEIPDQLRLLSEVKGLLKPGGRALIAEPKGHVTEEDFEETLDVVEKAGFTVIDRPAVSKRHYLTALVEKG